MKTPGVLNSNCTFAETDFIYEHLSMGVNEYMLLDNHM